MVSGDLRIEKDGPVATLVMDNPGKRNALTHKMWQQFRPVLAELEADDGVKVIVVRGAGTNFSAGADISAVEDILAGGAITAAEEALAACRKPTVAAIEGYCVGGGWQIAGACDLRLVSVTAIFGVTPAKLGIIYPLSGIQRLVAMVGPAAAKYLLFSADFVSAAEALRMGLVTHVLPAESLHEEVAVFAQHLGSRSQFSIQAQKDLIKAISAGGEGAEDLAERNAYWQREMTAGPDADIGIAAFLAKEKPRFKWLRPST